MQNAINTVSHHLEEDNFDKCTFSSPVDKKGELRSVVINSVTSPKEIKIEFRLQKHNDIKTVLKKDFIENDLIRLFKEFKQCLIKSETAETQILLNKKLKAKILTKTSKKNNVTKNHNREKKLFRPCPFNVDTLSD